MTPDAQRVERPLLHPEIEQDAARLFDPQPRSFDMDDSIRRLLHNGVRARQVDSRDREEFELDHWDPSLHTSMTSEQRRERAARLIAMSREIEERRRVA